MKILLLSDHINKPTGVGKVSRNLIKYSSAETEWVQLGGAWTHVGAPEDINIDGVKSVKVYPAYDYGSEAMLLGILEIEKPDVILHFTDPRFWIWLYRMEFRIRKIMKIPLAYYSIWDNYPIPKFNAPYYNSCDMLIAINDISYNIHRNLAPKSMHRKAPHGVDTDVFFPINWAELSDLRSEFRLAHSCDRVLFWNNINMKRKNPLQLMEAFAEYYRTHDNRCCLLMHTDPLDSAGANLISAKHQLYDDCNIVFSPNKVSDQYMNVLYNISDGVISISSNEGFGLSISEAAAVGLPAIVLDTGGLKDQGRRYNSITIDPKVQILSGSQLVPYIYQDFASTASIVSKLKIWKILINNKKALNRIPHPSLHKAQKMAYQVETSLIHCVDAFRNLPKSTITII